MNIAAASNMLMQKEGSDIAYIKRMQYFDQKEAEKKRKYEAELLAGTGKVIEQATVGEQEQDPLAHNAVYKAVLEGDKRNIVALAQQELQAGKEPGDIIDHLLIPAIMKVGEYFNDQVYFLPQLISSATAMETAITYLEPMITKKEGKGEMATIVVATVEGDVHDIGKNLVALMLRNYGYHVIDLGKDVPASTIIETALKEKASIVGLSALMTTTMMRMKDVIHKAAEEKYHGKIIIGGAAVTPSFSDEIGADGYSKDAAECVKLVGSLLAQ